MTENLPGIYKRYKKDLYYIDFYIPLISRHIPIAVSKWKWWLYRLKFWRFIKDVNYNILSELP